MAWYDEAVFYHIYPLGLLDAPKENAYTEPVHRLRELDGWIGYLSELGINAIYIGPLFESVGHGYETTDYKKLDSRLGSNEDLKSFVAKCHDKGIRVIFDGVFNHVGRDFFAFKDLKENREGSRYRDWFLNVNFWNNNEYNDGFTYDNWGGYNLLVKLNQKNPEVKDYICDVIRFWVSEFDVDGIRLDAADVLDFDYMRALRAVANDVKPDFWLMGEVIHGDYTRWVNGGTLHSVTNYALHKALYSGHNDHNYFEIAHTVKRLYGMGGNRPDGLKLYNFTDNHDVERIISKLYNRNNYYPVHILEFTLPGVPSIYYGSEFGIEGKKEKGSDASLRPAIDLKDHKNDIADNPYTAFISRLCRVRREVPALSYGSYRELMLTNRQYAYARDLDDTTILITVNNDENPAVINCGGIRDGIYTGALTGKNVKVENGSFRAEIAANYGEIWIPGNVILSADIKAEPIRADKIEKAVKEAVPAYPEIKDAQAETVEAEDAPAERKEKKETRKVVPEDKLSGAAAKYGLGDKYSEIDPESIAARGDYDKMSVEELQVAILEKMAANGPVNDQMIRTVMDNVYPDSLQNWVKSFR